MKRLRRRLRRNHFHTYCQILLCVLPSPSTSLPTLRAMSFRCEMTHSRDNTSHWQKLQQFLCCSCKCGRHQTPTVNRPPPTARRQRPNAPMPRLPQLVPRVFATSRLAYVAHMPAKRSICFAFCVVLSVCVCVYESVRADGTLKFTGYVHNFANGQCACHIHLMPPRTRLCHLVKVFMRKL